MAKTEATVAADITTEMAKDVITDMVKDVITDMVRDATMSTAKDATTDTKAATDAAATKEKNSTDKGLKNV